MFASPLETKEAYTAGSGTRSTALRRPSSQKQRPTESPGSRSITSGHKMNTGSLHSELGGQRLACRPPSRARIGTLQVCSLALDAGMGAHACMVSAAAMHFDRRSPKTTSFHVQVMRSAQQQTDDLPTLTGPPPGRFEIGPGQFLNVSSSHLSSAADMLQQYLAALTSQRRCPILA